MAAGTPASPSIHLQPWPAETHQQAVPMRGCDVTALTNQRLIAPNPKGPDLTNQSGLCLPSGPYPRFRAISRAWRVLCVAAGFAVLSWSWMRLPAIDL